MRRRRAASSALAALGAAGALGACGGGPVTADAPTVPDAAKLRLAGALARQPLLTASLTVSGRGARRLTLRWQRGIPLPAGGNFNGVRWERAAGRIPVQDVQSTLQYNATCQWVRAWSEGREVATADRVLALAPGWAGIRNADVAITPAFRVGCYTTAARERAYAIEMGRTPPR